MTVLSLNEIWPLYCLWDDIQGQILLGEDGLQINAGIINRQRADKKIPKAQQCVNRQPVSRLFFTGEKTAKRNKYIYAAHVKYCYMLK